MKKKKRERELEKLHETEDEKRARRLAKKAAKAEKQQALLGGYSNETNPWNDANLTGQFVWAKKVGDAANALCVIDETKQEWGGYYRVNL